LVFRICPKIAELYFISVNFDQKSPEFLKIPENWTLFLAFLPK